MKMWYAIKIGYSKKNLPIYRSPLSTKTRRPLVRVSRPHEADVSSYSSTSYTTTVPTYVRNLVVSGRPNVLRLAPSNILVDWTHLHPLQRSKTEHTSWHWRKRPRPAHTNPLNRVVWTCARLWWGQELMCPVVSQWRRCKSIEGVHNRHPLRGQTNLERVMSRELRFETKNGETLTKFLLVNDYFLSPLLRSRIQHKLMSWNWFVLQFDCYIWVCTASI